MTASSQQIQFRQRNRTYYADLERLHQLLVPPGLRVLEVGCGTGDLLAHLQPAHGVGIELNPEVAAVARERHPELRILATNAETMTPASIGETQPFDVILLPNTLNTLQDVQGVLERLEAFCHPRTRLVVSFHNWLWQPLLKTAERLGQRQPQPPESWLTPNDVRNLLDLASWEVLKEGQRCLIPRQIPLLTPLANR